jgi:hypothetical protein
MSDRLPSLDCAQVMWGNPEGRETKIYFAWVPAVQTDLHCILIGLKLQGAPNQIAAFSPILRSILELKSQELGGSDRAPTAKPARRDSGATYRKMSHF